MLAAFAAGRTPEVTMKVVAGFILAVVAIALGGLIVIYGGLYNVAASKPVGAITAWILSTTMRRSVEQHAEPRAMSTQGSDELIRQGFKVYSETCVYCHGAPGKDPVDIGKGLNPEPPYLPDTVGRWTAPQIFWIVKNGIKMTGMPSFGGTHSDAELEATVAFVTRLPRMTPEQYAEFEKQ